MSKVKCKCGGDICKGALWMEEDRYLWVRFSDTHENNEEREVQIFNGMDISTVIEMRDMLNDVIKRKAGL